MNEKYYRYDVARVVRDENGNLKEIWDHVHCDNIVCEGGFVRFQVDGQDRWILPSSALVEVELHSEPTDTECDDNE